MENLEDINLILNNYKIHNNYNKVLYESEKCINKLNNITKIGRTYNLLVMFCSENQKINDSIKYLKKMLEYKEFQNMDDIYINIIKCYIQLNNYNKSIEYGVKAFKINSKNSELLFLLCNLYIKINNYDKIIYYVDLYLLNANYEQNKNNYIDLLNNIYIYFYINKKYEVSIKYLKIALKYNKTVDNYNRIILSYLSLNYLDLGLTNCNLCIDLKPNVETYSYLQEIHYREKNYKKSVYYYELIIDKYFDEIKDNIQLLYNGCFSYFADKQLQKGYKLFEYRLIKPVGDKEVCLKIDFIPLWNKQDFKKLLIVGEQGYGDIVMYYRFVIEIAEKYPNKTFYFFCREINIFDTIKPNIFILENVNIHMNIDYRINLMSLPLYLDMKTITLNKYNYIKTSKEKNDYWDEKINKTKFTVGIVYFGLLKSWLEKEIPLPFFEKLLNLDIDIIILQKKEEINNDYLNSDFKDKIKIYNIDEFEPFKDTVSILSQIDLLVTIDTVIVHIAGVMNINTILLLGYYSEWRWFDHDECLWYNSVKLLRKKTKDQSFKELIDIVYNKLITEYKIKEIIKPPIYIPISIAELYDKYSILNIKKDKINLPEKLEHISNEIKLLEPTIKQNKIEDTFYKQLYNINMKLWDIEDNIRLKEKDKEYDDKFIELARSVYINNDIRAKIKSIINKKYNSNIFEIKHYN